VEDAVRKIAEGGEQEPSPVKTEKGPESSAIDALRQRLTTHFGTRVQLKSGAGEKGEIRIPFLSHDDLNRILDLLKL
jgi:ParB family chromosome partitioning protein